MKEAFDKMSVKLEREAQEREEAMQQIREQEAKLNEANARVSKLNCFFVKLYVVASYGKVLIGSFALIIIIW